MRRLLSSAAIALTATFSTQGCWDAEPPGPADLLIDAWIEVAGGPQAWRQVKNARFTVVTVWFDSTGTEVRRRPRYVWIKKNPERARIERDEPEGHYVQAHDGTVAWATLNGVRVPAPEKAAAEALYVGRDVFYWVGLPYKLRDSGVFLSYITPDSTGYAGARVSFGEEIGEHPGDRYFYYFGGDSPFPVEVHYIEQGKTSVNRAAWSDFRQADPITYVGTRTYFDEQGRRIRQLLIEDVIINPGVPDSIFPPPTGTG